MGRRRTARWRKVGEILLARVSTAPCGAALAALAYGAIAVTRLTVLRVNLKGF
jgi:phosphate/sulfate permease